MTSRFVSFIDFSTFISHGSGLWSVGDLIKTADIHACLPQILSMSIRAVADALLELKHVGAANILSNHVFHFVSSSKLDCRAVDTKRAILINMDETQPRWSRLNTIGFRGDSQWFVRSY